MARIGIIDWGIGGVSIYKLLKNETPGALITYFSDTGVTPYGKMTRLQLVDRLDAVIEFLKRRDVTHFVIGCNAASTAISHLADHAVPVLGVIEPAVERTAKLRPAKLGLIGGRRTVVSGVYRKAFAEKGISVSQRVAQPLSGLIENGDVASKLLQATAEEILKPIRDSSHILLACTHYPAITSVLKKFVSVRTQFIDPSEALFLRIKKWELGPGNGVDEFLTSGDASAMKRAAKAAFGVSITKAQRVTF